MGKKRQRDHASGIDRHTPRPSTAAQTGPDRLASLLEELEFLEALEQQGRHGASPAHAQGDPNKKS